MKKKEGRGKGKSAVRVLLTVLGIILCLVFGLALLCNTAIIIKGTINTERPPELMGITPLVVVSGSMSGDAADHIETGDLILVEQTAADGLAAGDIIAFMRDEAVVTHRIVEIKTDEAGELIFLTKGDANAEVDQKPATEDSVIGKVRWRIPQAGEIVLMLQTPTGMLVSIGVPIVIYIVYDIIRRQRYASKQRRKTEELEAELTRLREAAGESEAAEESSEKNKEEC